ncbi:hypothetical protein MA9V1_169 [Chryseobacterium phage MA9V-1]|nr:hypothetical protein MA9V1_169 [Chryseobacterium phage MA9V-1]
MSTFRKQGPKQSFANESISDVISGLSPEQIEYLATALMTTVAVGGTITYKAIMEKLKGDKKLKADQLEKLESAKK